MLSELALKSKYLEKLVVFQQGVFGSSTVLAHLAAMFSSLFTLFCFLFSSILSLLKKQSKNKQKKTHQTCL